MKDGAVKGKERDSTPPDPIKQIPAEKGSGSLTSDKTCSWPSHSPSCCWASVSASWSESHSALSLSTSSDDLQRAANRIKCIRTAIGRRSAAWHYPIRRYARLPPRMPTPQKSQPLAISPAIPQHTPLAPPHQYANRQEEDADVRRTSTATTWHKQSLWTCQQTVRKVSPLHSLNGPRAAGVLRVRATLPKLVGSYSPPPMPFVTKEGSEEGSKKATSSSKRLLTCGLQSSAILQLPFISLHTLLFAQLAPTPSLSPFPLSLPTPLLYFNLDHNRVQLINGSFERHAMPRHTHTHTHERQYAHEK